MPRAPFFLSMLLVGCSLFGFGCKHRVPTPIPTPQPPAVAPNPENEPPKKTKPPQPESEASPDIKALRQILSNLQKAKRYRITASVPSTSGSASGVLLFSKDRGMLAQLTTLDTRSELFIKDTSLWVRYATTSWQSVPDSKESRNIIEQMKTTFGVNNDGTSSIFLRDAAEVVEKVADRSGCTLYKVRQTFYVPVDRVQNIELCVTSAYPMSIRLNDGGQITSINYDQFDDDSILATSPIK